MLSKLTSQGIASLTSRTIGIRFRDGNRCLSTVRKEWEESHLKAPQGGAKIPEDVTLRQRRIIYRSKQRGWLELDILFGGWAAKHVPNMTSDRSLNEVEKLLDADTPDMLKWVMKQKTPPPQLDNQTMRSIQAYATGEGHVKDRGVLSIDYYGPICGKGRGQDRSHQLGSWKAIGWQINECVERFHSCWLPKRSKVSPR